MGEGGITCRAGHGDRAAEIADLFERTFAESEGSEEGRLIGALARDLMARTPDEDLLVVSALADGALAGCIVFSRLVYPEDGRTVFLLGPVAVAPGRQGAGVGTRLIRYGLAEIRARGAEVAITYGDPAYYARVGFRPISEETAQPPMPLGQPEGWLAQSLTGGPLVPLKGPSRCVAAFDDPSFW